MPDQFRDANESLRAIFKVAPGQSANLLSRERISRAKKMMTPFVLRRKKAQVLKDLPQKLERVEWCGMTELQREVYSEAIMRSKKALLEAESEELEELAEDEEVEGDDAADEVKPKAVKKKKSAAGTKTGNRVDTSSSTHVLTDLRKMSSCFPRVLALERPVLTSSLPFVVSTHRTTRCCSVACTPTRRSRTWRAIVSRNSSLSIATKT